MSNYIRLVDYHVMLVLVGVGGMLCFNLTFHMLIQHLLPNVINPLYAKVWSHHSSNMPQGDAMSWRGEFPRWTKICKICFHTQYWVTSWHNTTFVVWSQGICLRQSRYVLFTPFQDKALKFSDNSYAYVQHGETTWT